MSSRTKAVLIALSCWVVGTLYIFLICLLVINYRQKEMSPSEAATRQEINELKEEVKELKAHAPAMPCTTTYDVADTDSRRGLWGIAERYYGGRGYLNILIIEANSDKVKAPGYIIKAGWKLTVPLCLYSLPIVEKKHIAKKNNSKSRHSVSESAPVYSPADMHPSETPALTAQVLPVIDSESAVVSQSSQKAAVKLSSPGRKPDMFSQGSYHKPSPQKKERSVVMRRVLFPFKAVANALKHSKKMARTTLIYSSLVLGLTPIPQARILAIGSTLALSAFVLPARSQNFSTSAVSTTIDSPALNREEIERDARGRYTVPDGDLDLVSNTIFQQPPYGKDTKDAIEAMPRALASELNLSGVFVWNEIPGKEAVKVALEPKAIVIYQKSAIGITVAYLGDCLLRVNGKVVPWANRIRLIAPFTQQTSTPGTAPPATTPNVVTTNNLNVPTFPGTINLNLTGLPEQPAQPANTTQHVIYEVKRDWAAKFRDTGFGIMGTGIGVGVASFGIEMPQALVDAAKARRPDEITINNSPYSSSSSTSTSTSSSSSSSSSDSGSTATNSPPQPPPPGGPQPKPKQPKPPKKHHHDNGGDKGKGKEHHDKNQDEN
jgi:hypothetical protein